MTRIEPTPAPPVGPHSGGDTVNAHPGGDIAGADTTSAPDAHPGARAVGAEPVGSAVGIDPVEYSPWEFAAKARPHTRATQRALQNALVARPETHLGTDVFVSSLASVDCDSLSLGDRTYVAAGAYITGTISLGRDCSVNPYTVIRGDVRIGDATRIGAHTSLLGFNHTMTDPTVEFFRQPLVSRGIVVGDDVWIGSHVVVLDGVRIGSRSVLAAGAVVTKDVPEGAIVGGNPARFLKWRIAPTGESDSAVTATSGAAHHPGPAAAGASDGTGAGTPDGPTTAAPDKPATRASAASAIAAPDGTAAGTPAGPTTAAPGAFGAARTDQVTAGAGGDGDAALRAHLTAFANRARAEARDVLDRAWDGQRYLDRPGAAPTVRAWCDAIEIADLLLADVPPHTDRDALVHRLRSWQDAASGAVPPLDAAGVPRPASWSDEDAAYHVLAVGYALDLLGSSFPHELRLVSELTPDRVPALVEGLPWSTSAWTAGAWVDAYSTALSWERKVPLGTSDALFGALGRIADPATGMWGATRESDGLLQPVNGFYRASRGTFAQHGRPLPYPIAVIDTVLTHVEDARFFAAGRLNACNALDVAHPLWLTRGAGHRASEVATVARQLLDSALGMWQEGSGIAFAESPDMGVSTPGLQGTEMWLSIVWYLADLLDASDVLSYRPRGVHRPEPRL